MAHKPQIKKTAKIPSLPSELQKRLEAEYTRLVLKHSSAPRMTPEEFLAVVFMLGLRKARRVRKTTLLETLIDVEVMERMDMMQKEVTRAE